MESVGWSSIATVGPRGKLNEDELVNVLPSLIGLHRCSMTSSGCTSAKCGDAEGTLLDRTTSIFTECILLVEIATQFLSSGASLILAPLKLLSAGDGRTTSE